MWIYSNACYNKISNKSNIILFKNPNWQEAADQLAIYKVWKSWVQDYRKQIQWVAERRTWTRDLRITSPAP